MNKEDKKIIHDTVLIGKWEEVKSAEKIRASEITKNENDTELLDGLVISGYETKFGEVNQNGEVYAQNCLDDFIKKYFIKNELNMPVDINHRQEYECGKVLYLEANTKGFYFVVYVPREFPQYEWLKCRLKIGIIQGFSKYGYVERGHSVYKKDGTFDHYQIEKMRLLAVSLVSVPANSLKFDKMSEMERVQNALNYKNTNDNKTNETLDALDEIFS